MLVGDSCQVEYSVHISNNDLEQDKPRDWEATVFRLKMRQTIPQYLLILASWKLPRPSFMHKTRIQDDVLGISKYFRNGRGLELIWLLSLVSGVC